MSKAIWDVQRTRQHIPRETESLILSPWIWTLPVAFYVLSFLVKLGLASLLSTVKRAKRRYSAGFLKSGSIRFSGLLVGQKIKGLRFFEIVEEMLSLEGKESMRLEMERMREEMTTNFGFSVEIGAPYGWPRQSPPVQLELLPMRSSTHESETNAPAAPGSDSVTKPFSWAQQQPVLSRMNSSSGACLHFYSFCRSLALEASSEHEAVFDCIPLHRSTKVFFVFSSFFHWCLAFWNRKFLLTKCRLRSGRCSGNIFVCWSWSFT